MPFLGVIAMRRILPFLFALTLTPLAHAADNVSVKDAWVRLPPPGAQIVGAYLTLEAKQATTLTGAQSPAAESVEVHTMRMNKGVMQMRQLPSLPLPAGKPVQLQPGGLHLMLINLKKPLKAGDTVQIDLNFSQGPAKRKTETVRVQAVVRTPN
jgi:copper(I)-binding protein